MVNVSQHDIDKYSRDGYCLPHQQLFAEDKFNSLLAIFNELLENKGDKRDDELDVPHFRDERLFEFLMDKDVLDCVENFIGPDIGLWSSHFISKEPLTGRRTPWHEDTGYWSGRHSGPPIFA